MTKNEQSLRAVWDITIYISRCMMRTQEGKRETHRDRERHTHRVKNI